MIDWAKFLGSFVQIVPWIKTLRYALGIGAIILLLAVSSNIMEKLFPHKPEVTVSAGATYQAGEPRDTFGIGCNMWRLYIKGGLKSK